MSVFKKGGLATEAEEDTISKLEGQINLDIHLFG